MADTQRAPPRSLRRPALGTALFGLLVGAPVVALVPWALSGWRLREPLVDGEPSRWVGAALVVAGLPLWVAAAARFVRQGGGTPAPVAAPVRLVVTGLYRHVRNPMYLAVLAIVIGQALLLGSAGTLIYAICLALGFHLFVLLYEEPTLRARFGDEYAAYCRQVPRWRPRLRPARVSADSAR
jgi:protein-S-isoprenylcysteine O-methyltransferase Ste14